jgi:hypothetical protein
MVFDKATSANVQYIEWHYALFSSIFPTVFLRILMVFRNFDEA